MITIVDDLLTPKYSDVILSDAINVLQYTYSKQTSSLNDGDEYPLLVDKNTFDKGQFCCNILTSYPIEPVFKWYFNLLKPVIYTAQDKFPQLQNIIGIRRIKFNLLLQNSNAPEYHYNIPHQDHDEDNSYSMIYYCNDSDGDTFVFNEIYEKGITPSELTVAQRVTPKKNRALLFDSKQYHASSSPRCSEERIVINFVFDVQK